MAYKMFSAGLVIAFAGVCLCQQQQSAAAGALSQASFQTGSAAVVVQQPQTKLEDIERDSLAAAFGQKTQQQQQQQQQPPAKISAIATPAVPQQQQQAYQQQFFVQPYQAPAPLQFYVQPSYHAQQQQYLSPYQMAFDYNGVQYMIVNPNAYNSGSQMYYVPAPQPSIVPQYVTKESSPAASAAAQQEYKKQKPAGPGQAPQEYQQQQQQQQSYVVPTAGFQYVQQQQQPATAVTAAAAASPVDFSYVTRHPVTATQFKAPTPAVQPQFQYAAVPQQYQQPQYYYSFPAAGQVQAGEQPRVQQSAKSQFSSGVKSTTPNPLKDSFAYKFESSPPQLQQQQQQQQASAAYSTLKYSV